VRMPTVNYEHQCECGRRYRVEARRLPAREADSIECKCGRVIKEWSGAESWSATLLDDQAEKKSK